MALSYAGIDLLIQTEEHAVWLAKYAPLYKIKEVSLSGWRGTNLLEMNLPAVPEETPIEIGVLRWPTGASEHATFHCVINSTRLDLIRDYVDANGQYQNLVMSDGNSNHTITASMKMLPARPIHQIEGTEQLYLLTLVDKRFDWRWKSADISSQPASWSSLYSTLGTALGVTITPDTIDADYSTPSERWIQYRKPLPSLLDAAANSIQQRVVVALDGTVTTVNASTANTAATAAYANVVKLVGGTVALEDIQRYVPASVTTVFGKKTSGVWQDDPFTVNNTLTSLSITEYGAAAGISGLTATVFADLIYDGTNTTACNNLAAQTATDWYKWRLNVHDFTLPGIINWAITGAEDVVEWRYQDTGNLLTRVILSPWQEIPMGGFSKQVTPGASSNNVFHARLTAKSGIYPDETWSWQEITLHSSGTWIDGSGSGSLNARSVLVNGTLPCNPFVGLRVLMFPSKTAGWYEFFPFGYADGGTTGRPGIISTTDQYLGRGIKTVDKLGLAGWSGGNIYGASKLAVSHFPQRNAPFSGYNTVGIYQYDTPNFPENNSSDPNQNLAAYQFLGAHSLQLGGCDVSPYYGAPTEYYPHHTYIGPTFGLSMFGAAFTDFITAGDSSHPQWNGVLWTIQPRWVELSARKVRTVIGGHIGAGLTVQDDDKAFEDVNSFSLILDDDSEYIVLGHWGTYDTKFLLAGTCYSIDIGSGIRDGKTENVTIGTTTLTFVGGLYIGQIAGDTFTGNLP